jgi:hypothetical protein
MPLRNNGKLAFTGLHTTLYISIAFDGSILLIACHPSCIIKINASFLVLNMLLFSVSKFLLVIN